MPRPNLLTGMCGSLVRIFLLLNVLGAGAYGWTQPRGFSFGSLPYIEHEVLVPCIFAVSMAGTVGLYGDTRVALLGTGLLSGFSFSIAIVTLCVGSTVYAYGFGAMALIPLVMVPVSLNLARRQSVPIAVPLATLPVGAALGTVFLVCTWAPPATTRPSGQPPESHQESREATASDLELSPGPRSISIHRRGGGHVTVFPFLEFQSMSASGYWTVFDFGSLIPSGPPSKRESDGSLTMEVGNKALTARARTWIQDGEVHILSVNTLHTAIAAHLATAVSVYVPGGVRIMGHPWREGGESEFVAFRKGSLEFLRAARLEKGPFTPLAALPPGDPILETGTWRIQVRGWADQASRAESPTAGWGVSQGAIESDGESYFWELACTSIGRGFHAVRTAAGTYAFKIIITPLK